jgi:sulfur transfer complex TusBCD TusB component (DsrH family)
MSKGKQFLQEEYLPGALFIKTSFIRDRAEMVTRFAEYTPEYLVGFEAQITAVKQIQGALMLTEAQKQATANLYLKADSVNVEFNFVSSYFKKCKLDTKILSQVKKDLTARNIEGAIDKIATVIQMVAVNAAALMSKGMAANFAETLAADRDYLELQNALQNQVKNQVSDLYTANKAEYDALYEYIAEIANDGKIMYKGTPKAKEYTITKIIERMRSVNAGGGDAPDAEV